MVDEFRCSVMDWHYIMEPFAMLYAYDIVGLHVTRLPSCCVCDTSLTVEHSLHMAFVNPVCWKAYGLPANWINKLRDTTA